MMTCTFTIRVVVERFELVAMNSRRQRNRRGSSGSLKTAIRRVMQIRTHTS